MTQDTGDEKMATEDLEKNMREAIGKLPKENQEQIDKMIGEMNEHMDTDKHSIKDIIEFTKFILISLQLTVYLLAYRMKQEQENGRF